MSGVEGSQQVGVDSIQRRVDRQMSVPEASPPPQYQGGESDSVSTFREGQGTPTPRAEAAQHSMTMSVLDGGASVQSGMTLSSLATTVVTLQGDLTAVKDSLATLVTQFQAAISTMPKAQPQDSHTAGSAGHQHRPVEDTQMTEASSTTPSHSLHKPGSGDPP